MREAIKATRLTSTVHFLCSYAILIQQGLKQRGGRLSPKKLNIGDMLLKKLWLEMGPIENSWKKFKLIRTASLANGKIYLSMLSKR